MFLVNTRGFMGGTDCEQSPIVKDSATKIIYAVLKSKIPHIAIMAAAYYGADNYGMSSRSYTPCLLCGWPASKTAVMRREDHADRSRRGAVDGPQQRHRRQSLRHLPDVKVEKVTEALAAVLGETARHVFGTCQGRGMSTVRGKTSYGGSGSGVRVLRNPPLLSGRWVAMQHPPSGTTPSSSSTTTTNRVTAGSRGFLTGTGTSCTSTSTNARSCPEGLLGIPMEGHAVEARLWVKDVDCGFLPSAGVVSDFKVPAAPGGRVDSGVESGDEVLTDYEPMLAKIIARDVTRAEAIAHLSLAVRRDSVYGVRANRTLLVGLLEHEDVLARHLDTTFLEKLAPSGAVELGGVRDAGLCALAPTLADRASSRCNGGRLATIRSGCRKDRYHPQRPSHLAVEREILADCQLGGIPALSGDATEVAVQRMAARPDHVVMVADCVRRAFDVAKSCHVSDGRGNTDLIRVPRFQDAGSPAEPRFVTAPMPYTVVRFTVEQGQVASVGHTFLVSKSMKEAMKMERAVRAFTDGVVSDLHVKTGSRRRMGGWLIDFTSVGTGLLTRDHSGMAVGTGLLTRDHSGMALKGVTHMGKCSSPSKEVRHE